jgi:hypothetical protein
LFDRPYSSEFVFADNVEPVVLFPQARHPFLYYWFFNFSVTKALKKYNIDTLATNNSRECENFVKEDHMPLKSMVAQSGECILFNTDMFHDWDNSSSKNERMVLTLRLKDYNKPNSSFEDARDILLKLTDKCG